MSAAADLRPPRDFLREHGWLDTFVAFEPDHDAAPDADASLFHFDLGEIDHDA